MTGAALSIMADPEWPKNTYWPSKFIMAWLHLGVKVKPRSQLINKVMVTFIGTT